MGVTRGRGRLGEGELLFVRPTDLAPRLAPTDVATVRAAFEMGYYESPRRCRMEDIARLLGITKSAVYHRMSKVERTAVEALLRDGMQP